MLVYLESNWAIVKIEVENKSTSIEKSNGDLLFNFPSLHTNVMYDWLIESFQIPISK